LNYDPVKLCKNRNVCLKEVPGVSHYRLTTKVAAGEAVAASGIEKTSVMGPGLQGGKGACRIQLRSLRLLAGEFQIPLPPRQPVPLPRLFRLGGVGKPESSKCYRSPLPPLWRALFGKAIKAIWVKAEFLGARYYLYKLFSELREKFAILQFFFQYRKNLIFSSFLTMFIVWYKEQTIWAGLQNGGKNSL
jgi:hypothetical protein